MAHVQRVVCPPPTADRGKKLAWHVRAGSSSTTMIYRVVCIAIFALATSARGFEASEPDPEVPGAKFNKEELEEILRKEHSDRISNIYDSQNDIQ